MARTLLAHGASATTRTEEWYQTPLDIAANRGSLLIVKLLVENGCEIESQNPSPFTPAQKAAVQGHIDVVRYLLQMGAACVNTGSWSYTPFCSAASGGYLGNVELLLEYGANPRQRVRRS